MKRIFLAIFVILSTIICAKEFNFDHEEKILEKEFHNNFSVVKLNKDTKLKDIDVDIDDDGGVEVEIKFDITNPLTKDKIDLYAKEISDLFKDKITKSVGNDFFLKKLEIEAKGSIEKITENSKISRSIQAKEVYYYR